MFGQTQPDEITVSGQPDDQDPVSTRAVSIVNFLFAVRDIPAVDQLGLDSLIFLVGLAVLRRVSARN